MKKFTEPEILVENLEVEDVITTSGESVTAKISNLGDDQTIFS